MEPQNCPKSHSTAHKTNLPLNKLSTSIATAEQIIPLNRLTEHIELLAWRKRFQSYLIGCQWTKIQPFSDKQVIMYLKETQHLTSLKHIQIIRGGSIIKNVSKIFNGFKILHQKFGPFELSSQMIAFDGLGQPFVWMNKDYAKNQYKRDYISEQEFAQNILQILLKNQDRFDNVNFISQCYMARTYNYKLDQMIAHFQQIQEEEAEEKDHSSCQETASQKTVGLTFNKNRRPKKNARRGSACVNYSISSYGNCQFSRDLAELHNSPITPKPHSEDQLSSESTTNPFSKGASKIASFSSEKAFDQSFCFEPEDEKNSKVKCCQLSVSVVDFKDDKDEFQEKEIIVLPMLDKLNKEVVNSIISPQI